MAEDWAVDVRKYAPDASDAVIAAIVRDCGIALGSSDVSLVSFTDPAETDRVRDDFCRRKLGLTDPDPVVDAAIAKVGERMQGDRTKNRVTVYYLLAEAFGKLGLFGAGATAAADAVPPPVAASAILPPVAASPVVPPVAAAAVPLFATAAAAPRAALIRPAGATPPRAEPRRATQRGGAPVGAGTALVGCGLLGLIIVAASTAGSLVGFRTGIDPNAIAVSPAALAAVSAATPVVPTVVAVTPVIPTAVAAAPVIPTGAGVVSQAMAGKPMVSVYFATARSDISPDFAAAVTPLKAWIDGHVGARLAVSGYNDPRGNPAFNAELSKNRAKAVAAALVTRGVPATGIDLVKPTDTTETDTSLAQARRVDIVVLGR